MPRGRKPKDMALPPERAGWVEANAGLARRAALRGLRSCRTGRRLGLDELLQAAMIGLTRGAQRYDQASGYAASTVLYNAARWHVLNAIVRERKALLRQGMVMADVAARGDEEGGGFDPGGADRGPAALEANDEADAVLSRVHPRLAAWARLRFAGGMTQDEAAAAVGVSQQRGAQLDVKLYEAARRASARPGAA